MTDLQTLALLIEREHDGILARWRQRLEKLPRRDTRTEEVPALLANRGAPPGGKECIDGSALLRNLVGVLEREAAGADTQDPAPGLDPEASEALRGLRACDAERLGDRLASLVAEAAALRGCVQDLAAAQGIPLGGRTLELVQRPFDVALSRGIREAIRSETRPLRSTRDETARALAHDMRTPLNAIALAVEVLERVLPSGEGDSAAQRMVRSVRRNVEQLSLLASRLVERRGAETRAHRRVALGPLVRAATAELAPVARAANTRIVDTVPGNVVVEADGDSLVQVFRNLIANAIDHAPGGEILIGAALSSNTVICWVRDNGDGIATHDVGRLAEGSASPAPAASVRDLAAVERIVGAHGGRVAVESVAGFGATFWFELPTSDTRRTRAH